MQTGDRGAFPPRGEFPILLSGGIWLALVAEEEHRHRAEAGGPFFALFGAYQRTVRGAAVKELNVAVASVSASTCVLPSSAAYILCSSG